MVGNGAMVVGYRGQIPPAVIITHVLNFHTRKPGILNNVRPSLSLLKWKQL